MKITDVAVAILQRPDGSFLLSSRPEGKPYPHYWEFPGGKIEPGETVFDAMVRELIEELNVTITRATPWFTFMMHYTHATVRLHCWRVTEWHGAMQGMEGQQFEWQRIEQLTVSPTLPGCVPIFAALRLPMTYLISNASELGASEYLERLDALLQTVSGPAPMIQVREKTMAAGELESFARNVVSIAHVHGAKVLVNADEALAKRVGAHGVHLTSTQLAALSARPEVELVGASTHLRAELERAGELKCDFAVLGPVQKTLTHPGQVPLGWPRFEEMVLNTPLPCYALGGLSPGDMTLAVAHGAQGVAMQRGAI